MVSGDGRTLDPDFLLDGSGRSISAPELVAEALQAVNAAAAALTE